MKLRVLVILPLLYMATLSLFAQTPVVSTKTAFVNANAGTATLNGMVNAAGSATNVTFEYGTSTAFGNTINALPDSVFGNSDTPVRAMLTGLMNNTIYYYRVKGVNSNGVALGDTLQLYIGDNSIVNADFEFWNLDTTNILKKWFLIGDVTRVPSHDGSFAVGLEGSENDDFSAAFIGVPNDNGISGGAPFAARPDSMIGYFNYNIDVNDSAVILLFFKKNGVFNSLQLYYLKGSSGGNFERLAFPIMYFDTIVPVIPDTIILGLLSGDGLNGTPVETNFLAVDNISFSGTTENAPNNDFEDWNTTVKEKIATWRTSDETSFFPGLQKITKTTDSQHGAFAIRLENTVTIGGRAVLFLDGENGGGFPVNARHATLNGYLKYAPVNGDTLQIRVAMFKNREEIGLDSIKIADPLTNFTPFELNIVYENQTDMPDSANIIIGTTSFIPNGKSIIIVDNLSFDGFNNDSILVSVSNLSQDLLWKMYPNPANNEVAIQLSDKMLQDGIVAMFDASGRLVYSTPFKGLTTRLNKTVAIPLEKFSNGYYMVTIQQRGAISFKKLLVAGN